MFILCSRPLHVVELSKRERSGHAEKGLGMQRKYGWEPTEHLYRGLLIPLPTLGLNF